MTYRKSWIWSFQRTHYWTPKIQGGGNLPSWKSWNRHISTRNYPILMKFGIQIQSCISVTVTWTNVRIFKTQDGGRRHIENRKVTISQRKASTNTNKSNAYANKYQREIVSDAILSLRNADHRILVWTCASTEDLTNLSTQIHIRLCSVRTNNATHRWTDVHIQTTLLLLLLLRAGWGAECQWLKVFREVHSPVMQ